MFVKVFSMNSENKLTLLTLKCFKYFYTSYYDYSQKRQAY